MGFFLEKIEVTKGEVKTHCNCVVAKIEPVGCIVSIRYFCWEAELAFLLGEIADINEDRHLPEKRRTQMRLSLEVLKLG